MSLQAVIRWIFRRAHPAVAVAVTALAFAAPTEAALAKRPVGDSHVVAQLPAAPGYPEGIAIRGTTAYVATAARFGTAVVPPLDPPEVQGFDIKSGKLIARYIVVDKDPNQDHGLSGVAFDGSGRLYVLDTQWGIVRFDPEQTGTVSESDGVRTAIFDPGGQDRDTLYASAFPDLPPCGSPRHLLQPGDCSPATAGDKPPLPNDLAFDDAGRLYVSDSLQATIWVVYPAVSGTSPRPPQVWFQDGALGGAFGPNGVRVDSSGAWLYVVESVDDNGLGHLYRLTLGSSTGRSLEKVHTYGNAEVPDNIAFGGSGKIYVTLAGANQVQVLTADGVQEDRFSGPAQRSSGDVPYDMPSGVTLHSATGALLVNNHSEVLGIPDHFVVFDVYVDDRSEPLIKPLIP
ncbi:MAG: hypothetical protein M3O70_20730 [Actinomycetota bacterium]|nr:hypothetical protein [Actinomycetota bacterium]